MRIGVFLLAICFACCSFGHGQGNPKEITNSDVIHMVKAGIADDTIILAIKLGPVSFDVTPQGLIDLKTAGVSDKILNAIIASSAVPDHVAGVGNQQTAQAIFDKVVGALGDRNAIAAVHSVRWNATETHVAQGKSASFEREIVRILPDRVSMTLKADSSGAVQRQVITPDFNYRTISGTTTTIPSTDLEFDRKQLSLDTLFVAQHPQEFTVAVSAGTSSGGDVDLTISRDGATVVWNVDPQTSRIVGYSLTRPTGVEKGEYSDWRTVNGVLVAFKRHIVLPTLMEDITLTDFEVNPSLDEHIFDRPAQSIAQGLTLRVLQEQSVPYVQESGGGISTSCNIDGSANTSAYANSVGNSTFGNATTTSNQHMNCSSYDTTMRWPHVLNVMFAAGSDGNSYLIACDRAWRWSKCVPLKVGDVFNARFTNGGIQVDSVNTKGKEESPTYRVLQSRVSQ
jgi:hypothetical protein